jgi:proteasome lid subunit RPN8/RPN11
MTTLLHSAWTSQSGEYLVHVTQECFDAMMVLARKYFPNEVGTSLAGRYSDDGHVAFVTGLAPLTRDSRGARYSFFRGSAGLTAFFSKLFRLSGGKEHYVGDWHSHPGGDPTPSDVDASNALAIARDRKALCPECILVILALDEQAADIGVSIYSRARGRVALLRVPSTSGRL